VKAAVPGIERKTAVTAHIDTLSRRTGGRHLGPTAAGWLACEPAAALSA